MERGGRAVPVEGVEDDMEEVAIEEELGGDLPSVRDLSRMAGFSTTVQVGDVLITKTRPHCVEFRAPAPWGGFLGRLPGGRRLIARQVRAVMIPEDRDRGRPPEPGISVQCDSMHARGCRCWVNVSRVWEKFADFAADGRAEASGFGGGPPAPGEGPPAPQDGEWDDGDEEVSSGGVGDEMEEVEVEDESNDDGSGGAVDDRMWVTAFVREEEGVVIRVARTGGG